MLARIAVSRSWIRICGCRERGFSLPATLLFSWEGLVFQFPGASGVWEAGAPRSRGDLGGTESRCHPPRKFWGGEDVAVLNALNLRIRLVSLVCAGCCALVAVGCASTQEPYTARSVVLNDSPIGTDTNREQLSVDKQLLRAAAAGDSAKLRELIANGADVRLRESTLGDPPLVLAARNGDVDAIIVLLDAGASVYGVGNSNATALTVAAENGHTDAVRILLHAGAEVDHLTGGLIADQTVLMRAAESGHDETVDILLSAGADVHATSMYGVTALVLAARNGHTSVVQSLIDAGAFVRFEGGGALRAASVGGHAETAGLLVGAGAEVDAPSRNGDWTPLILASREGRSNVVAVLIAGGAEVSACTENGTTALMVAAENGHVETLALLLDAGANVGARDSLSRTALQIAAKNGREETLALLLSAGANVDAQDALGRTALMWASAGVHLDSTEILLDAGADTKLITRGGEKAIDLLVRPEDLDPSIGNSSQYDEIYRMLSPKR